jgi:hypothetical protein
MMAPTPIMSFREEWTQLAPLESFDPAAFLGTDEAPQELCNFVLTLALIYNDCKDALQTHVALGEAKPAGSPKKTRAWGAISGAQFHTLRTVPALMHELFELIRKNQDVLSHEFFETLLRSLPPKSRRAWGALVDVAAGTEPKDKLGKRLLQLRNNVQFHNGPKAIFNGYQQHFLSPAKLDERAFVSRGQSMRATRFYFADSAATGYARAVQQADELRSELGDMIEQVNHGLMLMVVAYIQRRGYAFRAEAES